MWALSSMTFWINIIALAIIVLEQVLQGFELSPEVKVILLAVVAGLNIVLRFLRGELPYFFSPNAAQRWREQKGL